MLEKILKVKRSIRNKKPQEEVRSIYNEYCKLYDQLTEPTIADKIQHRELFYIYTKYMQRRDL